jgi:hypothetical protein
MSSCAKLPTPNNYMYDMVRFNPCVVRAYDNYSLSKLDVFRSEITGTKVQDVQQRAWVHYNL